MSHRNNARERHKSNIDQASKMHPLSKHRTLKGQTKSAPAPLKQEAPVNGPNKCNQHQSNHQPCWTPTNDQLLFQRLQVQMLKPNRLFQLTLTLLQSSLNRQRRQNHHSKTKNLNRHHPFPARRTHQKTTWRPITMAMPRPSQRRVANHRAPTQTQSDPLRNTTQPTQRCLQMFPHPPNTAVPRTRPSHRPPLQQLLLPPLLILTK